MESTAQDDDTDTWQGFLHQIYADLPHPPVYKRRPLPVLPPLDSTDPTRCRCGCALEDHPIDTDIIDDPKNNNGIKIPKTRTENSRAGCTRCGMCGWYEPAEEPVNVNVVAPVALAVPVVKDVPYIVPMTAFPRFHMYGWYG